MNSINDSLLLRQRCRQWSPLITQQLRLRHLYQILAYNVSVDTHGSLYYTLHLTSMSAPFYTSEILNNTNPKWVELNVKNITNLSATAFVLRIWQKQDDNDTILITWGINLSGLVYLGNKLIDLQPHLFNDNAVILQLRGGYFSSLKCLKIDTPNNLITSKVMNVINENKDYKVTKYFNRKFNGNEIKFSYNLEKLRKLHSLQIRIRNKSLDVQMLRDEINSKCALCTSVNQQIEAVKTEPEKSSNIRYAPQLLTMNCLNKMLQEKPTRHQLQEIVKIRKEIEIFRFKTKLLMHEKDRKNAQIRQLKQNYTKLLDSNEETEYKLLENYRKLSKEIEKLKEWKQEQIHHHEVFINLSSQLHHRRRQLVSQLLSIYPIIEVQKNKYFINNVYLPEADLLADYTDNGLSAALGYVAHILTMCASFLQVPLRYPVCHVGSRSCIVDNVTPNLLDRDREFPLYTKGKDRMQFIIAVFLLNKNIAQLRYLYGLNTPELKSTLRNLLSFLQGKDGYRTKLHCTIPVEELAKEASNGTKNKNVVDRSDGNVESDTKERDNKSDSGIDQVCSSALSSAVNFTFKDEQQYDTSFTPSRKRVKPKQSETGPGLSEILAVPEAFLNKQITSSTFKNYINNRRLRKINFVHENNGEKDGNSSTNSSLSNVSTSKANGNINTVQSTPIKDQIVEQATEMTSPNNCCTSNVFKRKSRSVGSYTDEDSLLEYKNNCEVGSDPLINIISSVNDIDNDPNTLEAIDNTLTNQREYLEKWLDSGPALITSEESLYPEEILGVEEKNVSVPQQRQLTLRTDALLNTTSFNLVKPKL